MSSKIHSTHSPATQNAAQHSDSTVPAESPDTAASRRRFLTTSSAIAGGVFAASAAPRVHAAGDARGSTIKIGVVGCGGRGSGAIRNALNAGKDVKLVAVADLFEENVTSAVEGVEEQAKTIYKGQVDVPPERRFTGFDCYQQMLGKTDVDVVLLTSPPAYRPAQIEAAVAAGKHVFCEKPIATDPTGVRRVMAACQAAKEKNLNIVSGLCWRYDTGVKETMKRIHDGAIGEIITAQSNYLAGPVWVRPKKENETEMHYQCRNWYYFTWLSGDHIVEQFIHGLDKLMWLHHDTPPVKAYGMGGRQRRSDFTQGEIYDHFHVVYEWADGTRAFANTRQIRGCMNQTDEFVYGTKGQAVILQNRIKNELETWEFDSKKKEGSMYDLEHVALFDAIRGDRDTINNGTYMCQSTLMAILGREVCYSGREISWEDAMKSEMDLMPKTLAFDAEAPEPKVRQPGKYRFR